nr:MAG TPA: Tail tape measure [Caudoviricetes sp.]
MAQTKIGIQISANGSQASAEIDKIKSKIQSMSSQVSKGIEAGAAVAGISLMGVALKEVATTAAQTADRLTSIRSRLNLVNDGTQTTADLMNKIYDAAQRTRGGYDDMADSVAKLNMLAKDAFSSNDEAIEFVEQMNKQFKISGASIQESSAAMYQLTQSMAAGKLQGDEFHSIMENAPMLAQSIAKEMGMTVGELKNVSSEGMITADVIKNALFNSAEETNAKFAEMPMTFAEVGQSIQNEAIMAFQPVLEQLSSITADGAFQDFVGGITVAFRAMAAAAQVSISVISGGFNAMGVAISTVTNMARSFGTLFITTMPRVSAAVVAVVAGFTLYRTVLALCSTQVAALTVRTVALRVAEVASTVATKALAVATGLARVAFAGTLIVMGALTMGTTVLKSLYTALRASTLGVSAAQAVLNAVMRANPVGIVITIIGVLIGVYVTASAAANGFGETMRSVWNTIVHTVTWGVNQAISLINMLISALNAVGNKVASVFGTTFSAIDQINQISADSAQEFADSTANTVSQVFDGVSGGGGGDMALAAGGGDAGGGASGGGGHGGSGGGGGGASGEDLAKEAKQTHEKILQSFLEMMGKKRELVEIDYKNELDELNKSKDANENYQEDLANLNAVYADKRIKAKQEEVKKILDIENTVRDYVKDFNFNTAEKDSTGSVSPMTQLKKDYEDGINEIVDKYADMQDRFIKMDKMEQEAYIKALKDKGVAFELSADGEISFEEMKNEELLAKQKEFNEKSAQAHRELQEQKWEIDEAMRTQNFEALQAALDDEYVAQQQHYDTMKELMTDYQQAVIDSHWNGLQVMWDAASAGVDKLQEGISGLLQGTMSVTQAFQNMGKAILKTISDSIAQWIAGQLKQAILGKMLQSQQTAASIAAAQAQLPAWSALAQQVSMATFGASAASGMAAWSSSTAAGIAQSTSLFAVGGNVGGMASSGTMSWDSMKGFDKGMLRMAEGGLAYGPTYAQIGEGRYEEAVIPLSDTVFSRLGEGINRAGGNGVGGGITLNVNAIDAQSFGDFLESRGGRAMRQFLVNQDREFINTAGTW